MRMAAGFGLWIVLVSSSQSLAWLLPRPFIRRNSRRHVVSWDYALAVIPPEDAWDRIQRARHIAKDQSYAVWPPAIRLFHPFADDTALDVAHVIEKYQIEPFTITLSEWSIVPHQEALEDYWRSLEKLQIGRRQSPGDEKVAQLIEREERVGKKKKRERRFQKARKIRQRQLESGVAPEDVLVPPDPDVLKDSDDSSKRLTSGEITQQQKNMYEEFNGPCVIVLEPDEDSKEKLMALRYLLCDELKDSKEYATLYSPSGSVAPHTIDLPPDGADYRPVVPIAAFSNVNNAIAIARDLRRIWEPLTFNVTDLHVISCVDSNMDDDEEDGLLQEYKRRQTNKKAASDEAKLMHNVQFGCDALISLVGTEIPNDLDAEMRRFVEEQGEPGGYGRNETLQAEDLEVSETNLGFDLEEYLLGDEEDYDQGTVVVINRVQFFTGEMREYVGMPASSALDARDKTLGDNFVSGAARRRTTVHRQGVLYEEGDFGRKDVDYEPWGKSERRGKEWSERKERHLEDLD